MRCIVLAIVFGLIGAVALYALPVTQYLNVVPPTISVTTRYPGASAETVMNTVALLIKQRVNGVQHMLYMQSTSASDGSYMDGYCMVMLVGANPTMSVRNSAAM